MSLSSSRPRPLVRLAVIVLAVLALVSSWPGPARAAGTGGRLSGVVRDNNGATQSGARVVLVDAAGVEAGRDVTGSGGIFSVDVAPGRYDVAVVTAAPVERIARVRGVDVGAESVLDVVVLPPFVTLSGTVRDRSGAPFGAGGSVTLGEGRNSIPDGGRIDGEGRYSLRVRPGTYRLSVVVGADNGNTYLSAGVDSFTLADNRVQDLTFAATSVTVAAVDEDQHSAAIKGVHLRSPDACRPECPAGFELFPGSGQATGEWWSSRVGASALALPGDITVTAYPADPALAQVTEQPFNAPWPNPVRVVMGKAPPVVPLPDKVTWNGVVRHNGVPVDRVEVGVQDETGWDSIETGPDGRFELQITPGQHRYLKLWAHIGFIPASDSDGEPPALSVEVPDFEITGPRTMDIDIPTTDLAVHVVDENGDAVPGALVTANSGGSRDDPKAPVEIFPGGRGNGAVWSYLDTDAAGNAPVLMFPGTPPAVISADTESAHGSATPDAGDRSVTVHLVPIPDNTVTLSGTIRDARGPLPLVNAPWVSFGGQASDETDEFEGDYLESDGRYALDGQAGRHQLTISDLPDHDHLDTQNHIASPTLPAVWSITTEVDLPTSKTLDLTIPDVAPARFRTVNADGLPYAADYSVHTEHTVDLGPKNGEAMTESSGLSPDGTFEHLLFGAATATGAVRPPGTPSNLFSLRVAPGDDVVLAIATRYTGGELLPPPAPAAPDVQPPSLDSTPDLGAGAATNASVGRSGYWALASDGAVYRFGEAVHLGNGTPGAVDLEPTPSGQGYWVLSRAGAVQTLGDALPLGNIDLSQLLKGEAPASLSATPSGKGYWVFTNRGRAIPFGDAPFLGDASNLKLNGPVLGSVATPTGRGYYMVASDGGIFAFGDAAFGGSMGDKKLNAPVQSLVPDSDGKGYWLVASDGGIFAFDAPFRGSMGDKKLNKPVVGMVRYGTGYLMVGADGGIFNFSNLPFAGSLGDKPPASPVVAVAALP